MADESKKKKTKKATGASEGGNGSDTLKTFIDSIIMKVEDSDVKIKRTRSARKPEERRDDDPKQKLSKHSQQLTDCEIVELWNSFKVGFPEGQVSKPQIIEIVRKVFPKCDADIVLRNIFRALDRGNTGKISPRDLMMTFTMAMSGSIEEKLHWSFKLYDLDGNEEIDMYEMEKIFVCLCTIVEASENEQSRRNKKLIEKSMLDERQRREKAEIEKMMSKQREAENARYAVTLYSQNFRNKETAKTPAKTKRAKSSYKKTSRRDRRKISEDLSEETKTKVVMAVDMVRELSDPVRDYKKFDYKKRAHELFNALDEDGSGGITESEYVKGCKSDQYFVKLLTDLSQDFIWGYYKED